jgi:hypothetical protein
MTMNQATNPTDLKKVLAAALARLVGLPPG